MLTDRAAELETAVGVLRDHQRREVDSTRYRALLTQLQQANRALEPIAVIATRFPTDLAPDEVADASAVADEISSVMASGDEEALEQVVARLGATTTPLTAEAQQRWSDLVQGGRKRS